jgi:hypothetical protein
MEVRHRKVRYHIDLSQDKIKLTVKGAAKKRQPVKVNGRTIILSGEKTRTIGIRN